MSDLKEQIESVLTSAGIPYDSVEVADDNIVIRQIGLHESSGAIVNILHTSGLRRLDELKSNEDVDTFVDDALHTTDMTTVTLPR